MLGPEEYIDNLLTRYLFDELETNDRSFVVKWINQSKENRRYFDELKATAGLLAQQNSLDKIDVEEEWEQLQQQLSVKAVQAAYTETGSPQPGVTDSKKGANRKKRSVYRFAIRAMAAASLMAAVLVAHLFNAGRHRVLPAPQPGPVVYAGPVDLTAYHAGNYSDTVKAFVLPDGSRVRLSGKSELTYSEPAGSHRRKVTLKGESNFEVEKDRSRPFIVVSGNISTMAVGTRFTVTAYESGKSIQVKLDEGKVLVQCSGMTAKKQTDDFYLLPGQRLIYNKNRQTAMITSRRHADHAVAVAGDRKNGPADHPLLPVGDQQSWFMFNNQSLAETFHGLEAMYNVKIIYERKDIAHRYFIGTFHKSDSIENILRQISVLNKLTVTKENSTFTISRSP